MIIPTIHLNGTSGEALLDQITTAGQAAQGLLRALSAASPNGRDYYLQGPNVLRQAEAEHRSRVGRVQSVFTELGELAEAIANEIDIRA